MPGQNFVFSHHGSSSSPLLLLPLPSLFIPPQGISNVYDHRKMGETVALLPGQRGKSEELAIDGKIAIGTVLLPLTNLSYN